MAIHKPWTYDRALAIVKTCHSMNEVRKKHACAYDAIKHYGWADLKQYLLSDTNEAGQQTDPEPVVPCRTVKWTREAIGEAMQKCSNRKEFRLRYDRAYEVTRKNGWVDLFDTYLPKKCIPWTRERLTEAISACNSRLEFRRRYPNANMVITKNGWEDLLENLPEYPSKEDEEPIWSVYRWHFIETNAVYIGLTMDYARRIRDELRYSSASCVHDYIESTGCSYTVTELHGGLSSSEAAELEIAYIAKYRADGYTVINRNRGGSLGSYNSSNGVSDGELLKEIFSKFSTYTDLCRKGQTLYRKACYRGLKPAILEILPKQPRNMPKYSRDELAELAGKYGTREEFRENMPKEYNYILRHNYRDLLPPKKAKPRPAYMDISESDIRSAAEKVCNGELARKEAAKTLGISTTRFGRLAAGLGCSLKVRKHRKLWDRESLLSEVKSKCRKLSDLKKHGALKVALYRHGMYAEVSSMLEHTAKQPITREDAMNAASQCTTYIEFLQKYTSMYMACYNHGWSDILDSLPRKYRPSHTVTDEEIRLAFSQCSSRTEFNTRFRTESYAAKKRGIYDELVAGMPKQTAKRSK